MLEKRGVLSQSYSTGNWEIISIMKLMKNHFKSKEAYTMTSIEEIFNNSNQLIDGIHHFLIATSAVHSFGNAESKESWTRLYTGDMNMRMVRFCIC